MWIYPEAGSFFSKSLELDDDARDFDISRGIRVEIVTGQGRQGLGQSTLLL